MQLLFGTWNHFIPLAIVKNKSLKVGDIIEVRKHKYYVNCEPGMISPSGKKIRFYYCVCTNENAEVTNSLKKRRIKWDSV